MRGMTDNESKLTVCISLCSGYGRPWFLAVGTHGVSSQNLVQLMNILHHEIVQTHDIRSYILVAKE